jgi:hypothetical protein
VQKLSANYLVIIAFVGSDLHIRIFDIIGRKVVDRAEEELVSGKTLKALKQWLNSGPNVSSLSKENKQKIIIDATSIAGLVPATGFTHSSIRPAVLTGYWWSSRRQRWVTEQVSEFIIDYNLRIETDQLDSTAEQLEQTIKEFYLQNQCRQDEIWIIVHQIISFT